MTPRSAVGLSREDRDIVARAFARHSIGFILPMVLGGVLAIAGAAIVIAGWPSLLSSAAGVVLLVVGAALALSSGSEVVGRRAPDECLTVRALRGEAPAIAWITAFDDSDGALKRRVRVCFSDGRWEFLRGDDRRLDDILRRADAPARAPQAWRPQLGRAGRLRYSPPR